jgi:hypothetical protein
VGGSCVGYCVDCRSGGCVFVCGLFFVSSAPTSDGRVAAPLLTASGQAAQAGGGGRVMGDHPVVIIIGVVVLDTCRSCCGCHLSDLTAGMVCPVGEHPEENNLSC